MFGRAVLGQFNGPKYQRFLQLNWTGTLTGSHALYLYPSFCLS